MCHHVLGTVFFPAGLVHSQKMTGLCFTSVEEAELPRPEEGHGQAPEVGPSLETPPWVQRPRWTRAVITLGAGPGMV